MHAETDCNKFMPGFTLPGPHLPGTGNAGSDQDCLKKCRDNPSCNAIVRPGDGRCILKKVATNVSPVPRPSSLKSYIICPSKGGSGKGGSSSCAPRLYFCKFTGRNHLLLYTSPVHVC